MEQRHAAIDETVEALFRRMAKEEDNSGPETTEESQLGDTPEEQECKPAAVWKRVGAGTQAMQAVQRQVLQRVHSRAQAVRAEEEQIWMIQREDQELHREVMVR